MILGAITNSWQRQLPEQALGTLVEEAQRRGARHVELRATCLGDCETGTENEWRPVLSKLQSLVDQFPDVSFNMAVPFPCLSITVDAKGGKFQAALEAATLVGRGLPHLRIVDGQAFEQAWESPNDIPPVALGIAALTREAAHQGVVFSIENVGQPLRSMTMLVREIRARLSVEEGAYLGLCIDLINQLRAFPDSDPLADLAAMPVEMIKMAHIKQTRDSRPHPTVDTGDLDCRHMFQLLQSLQYDGPVVLEIPPHARALENLSASFAFLQGGSA